MHPSRLLLGSLAPVTALALGCSQATLAAGRACDLDDGCAPMSVASVRVLDSLARATRDSLVVTLHSDEDGDWTVSLGRERMASYRQAVDSVGAARAKK